MSSGQQAPEAVWAAEMSLLTNRFFLYDGLKLFLWLAIILTVLVAFIAAGSGSFRNFPVLLALFGWIIAGFLYLFVLICWIFFGNRFPMSFRVGPRDIGWLTLSRRGKTANRLALVAGAATGSLSGMGAGMLAMSEESGSIEWRKVGQVKKYPEDRVITVMNSWRVVARLYCTPENYSEVAALLDYYYTASRSIPAPGPA